MVKKCSPYRGCIMNEFATNETSFLGRNGKGRCLGFNMLRRNGCVAIYPVTSRGHNARCYIEIDNCNINDFIHNLKDEMMFGLVSGRKSDGHGTGKSYSIIQGPVSVTRNVGE